MDKKVIKLTESELNEIVKESVAKIVKEASYDDKGNFIQSQHNDDLRVRFESELEKVNKFISDEMMTLSNIATSAMDEEIKKRARGVVNALIGAGNSIRKISQLTASKRWDAKA